MQDTKRIWVWLGVVVVVIGGVLVFLWRPSVKAPAANPGPSAAEVYATQFPKELVIAGIKNVTSSFSTPGATTTVLYTAVFTSSSSMADIYSDYIQYLLHNHWAIVKLITNSPNSRGIQAENATSSIGVAILPNDTETGGIGSQVTIFVTKK
jgi:hypothetical protein